MWYKPGFEVIENIPSYYADPETAKVAERLHAQPGMRILFDTSKTPRRMTCNMKPFFLKDSRGRNEYGFKKY